MRAFDLGRAVDEIGSGRGEQFDVAAHQRLQRFGPAISKDIQFCVDWKPTHGIQKEVTDAIKRLMAVLTQSAEQNHGPGVNVLSQDTSNELAKMLWSLFLQRFCDAIASVADCGNPLGDSSTPEVDILRPESWSFACGAAQLLYFISSQPKVPVVFRWNFMTHRVIGSFIRLWQVAPKADGPQTLRFLALLRLLLVDLPAPEKVRLKRVQEADQAGFFRLVRQRLSSWVEWVLSSDSKIKHGLLLFSFLGDIAKEILREEDSRETAIEEDFVPVLHEVLVKQLLREPLIWPRALSVLVDSTIKVPCADYVKRSIELSKVLRCKWTASPSAEANTLPSLLCLRMEELRRKAKPRNNCGSSLSHYGSTTSRTPSVPPSAPGSSQSARRPPRTPRAPGGPPISPGGSQPSTARRHSSMEFPQLLGQQRPPTATGAKGVAVDKRAQTPLSPRTPKDALAGGLPAKIIGANGVQGRLVIKSMPTKTAWGDDPGLGQVPTSPASRGASRRKPASGQ